MADFRALLSFAQEAFFHGLQPVNLFVNTITRSVLQKRLLRLVQPRMWIDVLLCSYQVDDPATHQQTRGDVALSQASTFAASVSSQDIAHFINGSLNMPTDTVSAEQTGKSRRVLRLTSVR